MKSKKTIMLVVVIVAAAAMGAFAAWKAFFAPPTFYAVQLTTGEMYFGRAARFPYGLRQVYLLTRTEDEEQPVSVQRFVNSLIGPEDFIRLNRAQVVWSAKLDPRGQLVQAFANPQSAAEVPQGAAQEGAGE